MKVDMNLRYKYELFRLMRSWQTHKIYL